MTDTLTPATETENVFVIRDIGRFHSKWDEIARRAERTGVEVGYEVLADEWVEVPCTCEGCQIAGRLHAPRTEHQVTVRVWGETPRFAGWDLLAVIDDLHEPIRQVRGVPGREDLIPEDAWFTDDRCDHCGYNRRRHTVMLLAHEDGTQVQVGSTCIKDFLGGHSPETVAWMTTWLPELRGSFADDEDGMPRYRPVEGFTPLGTLVATYGIIQDHGWVSRGAARDDYRRTATADLVALALGPAPRDPELAAEHEALTSAIGRHAQAARVAVNDALVWLVNTPATNDYLRNLKALLVKSVWTAKDLGLACSIVPSARRALEEEARKAAEAERRAEVEAEPVPNDGARHTVTGRVLRTDVKANDFGVRHVWTVEDDRGFRVWGTIPTGLDASPEVNDRVTFVARLERSDRDDFFGFYSRPTKGQIL